MAKVNYIVALYPGERRSYEAGVNSPVFDFLKKHFQFLESKPEHISAATFALSSTNDTEVDQKLISMVDDFKKRNKLKCFCYLVKNEYASYGAWNKAILKNSEYKNFTHSFLIEDDYIPVQSDFIDFFLKALNKEKHHKFAASLYTDNHASISNGLLDNSIIPTVLKDNSNIFFLEKSATATGFWSGGYFEYVQKTYLDFIKKHGSITDICDIAHTIFYKTGRYIKYGNIDKKVLIEPLN